ncbi:MAG: HAD family hydrolase [Candidatus Dojkabacteria bacterium]|nr:HAD family hydrolase [Candidatus Dojkabacteria bacterium]
MKYKALLFDVDDTLCQTAGTKSKVFDRIYHNHEVFHKVAIDEYRKILLTARDKYFDKLVNKGFNTYARIEFWFDIAKQLDIRIPIVELSEIVVEYWKLTYETIIPYEGLVEMLETLRKMPDLIIATLTAGDYYSKTEKLITLGIEEYFDYNFVTELVQKPKTDTAIYQYVLNYLELQPNEVLMIGDKPHEDIAPPNKVGIDTIQVTIRGDFQVSENGLLKPDFTANHLDKIVNIVKN